MTATKLHCQQHPQAIVEESTTALYDNSTNSVDSPWNTPPLFENDGAYADDENE